MSWGDNVDPLGDCVNSGLNILMGRRVSCSGSGFEGYGFRVQGFYELYIYIYTYI